MTVAAYGMVICGTDDMHQRYRGRIEKVKFGVPVAEAFSHDIPATLLVLLLKVNKEGPLKKDIWRAPGNQAQVRKLSHIMQNGRLVNISNISVYTAASVIKKFLSKLPGGIFGNENEQELFSIVQQPDSEQQRQVFCRVICSLSLPCQHLLVLLFGTFRIISDSSDTFGTRMTPDAIGISVAPSLFHTCIHDGQRAKLEDVMRFKLASQVISKIIQGFGYTNLFPRECYEFYARITGRTLRVDEHWHFTFQYPSITGTVSQPELLNATGQQNEAEDEVPSLELYTRRRNTADVSAAPSTAIGAVTGVGTNSSGDLTMQQRLSASMGEVLMTGDSDDDYVAGTRMTSSKGNETLESTQSLCYLEWVHERQTKRMRTRSEWFLSPLMPTKGATTSKSIANFDTNKLNVDVRAYEASLSSLEDMHVSPKVPGLDFGKTPRAPLQELQEVLSTAETTPEDARTPRTNADAETIFASGVLPAVVSVKPNTTSTANTGSCSSTITRRKSWRTHYIRPNKSLDSAEDAANDSSSSHSNPTPARRSSVANAGTVSSPGDSAIRRKPSNRSTSLLQ